MESDQYKHLYCLKVDNAAYTSYNKLKEEVNEMKMQGKELPQYMLVQNPDNE